MLLPGSEHTLLKRDTPLLLALLILWLALATVCASKTPPKEYTRDLVPRNLFGLQRSAMEPLPLDHIRLLYIEAGIGESPICCRLVTTSLEASPPYEALSYTWGSTEQDSTITCDGVPFFVTQNLYDAVQYLRNPEHERIMWIDAVCINQRHDQERTEQVGIMKDIYAEASRVVIWLGKETSEDELAFSMLDRFKEIFAKYGLVDIGPYLDQSLGFPPMTDPDWPALVMLFQREWFQRIWVVQEATMARESIVVCGSHSVIWKDISWVALSLRHQGYIGTYPVHFHTPKVPGISCLAVIYYLNQAHKIQDNTWGLLDLLRLTRKYISTDPRDKVFALMGIVTDSDTMDIKADYRLSAVEVYLSVAIYTLEKLKNLELLGNGGSSSTRQNSELPSWVPDWSHDNDRRMVIAAVARRRGMSVSGDTQPALSISADKKVLIVRGAIIDTISRLDTTIFIGDEDAKLDHATIAGAARIALRDKASFESYLAFAEAANKFLEGHDREESLWRTLCCDMTTQIPARRAPAEYAAGWKVLRKHHQITKADGSLDWTGVDMSDIRPNVNSYVALSNAIGANCAGRNLCITAGGYLGYVSSESKIGDEVCILFGSAVPYILREDKDGFFVLVGECYVHGIMDGEAMKERDMESLNRDFQLI